MCRSSLARFEHMPELGFTCPHATVLRLQKAHTQEQPVTTGFVDADLDADPEKICKLEATKVEVREVQEAVRPLSARRLYPHHSLPVHHFFCTM